MNRKQFLFLVFALLVLGGVGVVMFRQNLAEYQETGSKIGAKLLPNLKVADVAQIELRDPKGSATLVRKEHYWVVSERENYPADFKAISDFIIKLSDLKVVQNDTLSESGMGAVELREPGKGEGAGTRVELKDAGGKALAVLVIGKTILKKDPLNPLPSAVDGVPAGRYIRVLTPKDHVVVVSDPLSNAQAQPGRWLDKDFAKVDRVKTLTVAGDNAWKITRDEEWGQWKLVGGGDLNAGAAVTAVNALSQLSFSDVVTGAKLEDEGKPTVVTAETFDNLTYTIKVAKRKTGSDYLLNVAVAGELPAQRTAEKGEKAEDKERRDKDFTESRKRLELRLARDKARSGWTYVVEAKQVEPLTRSRADLIAPPRKKEDSR